MISSVICNCPAFGTKEGYDWWGVHWTATDNTGGMFTPTVGYPPVLTDITKWREQVKFPDISNIDWESDRGLKRSLIETLASCDWIRNRHNCIITGMTGCGKTWIAEALAHAACVQGFTVKAITLSQLIKEYQRNNNADNPTVQKPYLAALDKLQLLLIDDWGMDEITRAQCFSLYEMINRIKPHCSFLITSVIPVKDCWAQYLGDPTLADSILDRLVPNSYRIDIKGESMRSKKEYGALPKNK